jgi:hypothetical protein
VDCCELVEVRELAFEGDEKVRLIAELEKVPQGERGGVEEAETARPERLGIPEGLALLPIWLLGRR